MNQVPIKRGRGRPPKGEERRELTDTTGFPKILNKHKASSEDMAGGVYIGRGSRWGNPFPIGEFYGDREEVVVRHEKWIKNEMVVKPTLLSEIRAQLGGKNLICFCAPLRCHGEILRVLANAPESELQDIINRMKGG